MNRRGFLRVMVGGVAVVALPALPVIAAPSPKESGVRFNPAVRNAIMDGVAAPAAAYLVVTLIENGQPRPLYFSLDPVGWDVSQGHAIYKQPISITINGPCKVAPEIQIVDSNGRWLVKADLLAPIIDARHGDTVHIENLGIAIS